MTGNIRRSIAFGSWIARAAEAAVEAQDRLDSDWLRVDGEGAIDGSLARHAAAGQGIAPRFHDLWRALAPPRSVVAEMEVETAVEVSSERQTTLGAGLGLRVLPLEISVLARHRYERVRAGRVRVTVAAVRPEPPEVGD